MKPIRPTLILALSLVAGLPAEADTLPDLAAFRARLDAAEDVAGRAREVGAVMMQMQNQLTDAIYTRNLKCDDETSSLLARERHLGHAYRDLLQAWRVEVNQLQRERGLPTVAPLVLDSDHERIAELMVELNRELQLWRTAAAWQRTRIEPWAGVCPAVLVPDEGLAPWSPHAPGRDLTVVIGAGPGRICPPAVPAEGTVAVIEGDRACYAVDDCECEPRPVTDGAVLGEGR